MGDGAVYGIIIVGAIFVVLAPRVAVLSNQCTFLGLLWLVVSGSLCKAINDVALAQLFVIRVFVVLWFLCGSERIGYRSFAEGVKSTKGEYS